MGHRTSNQRYSDLHESCVQLIVAPGDEAVQHLKALGEMKRWTVDWGSVRAVWDGHTGWSSSSPCLPISMVPRISFRLEDILLPTQESSISRESTANASEQTPRAAEVTSFIDSSPHGLCWGRGGMRRLAVWSAKKLVMAENQSRLKVVLGTSEFGRFRLKEPENVRLRLQELVLVPRRYCLGTRPPR